MIEVIKALLLGIIQGITEWLPVSSTGHMILLDQFLHLAGSKKFVDTFLVVIQFGSILAVLILYFEKLNPFSKSKSKKEKKSTWSLWIKVIIAVIPSGVIGVLFEDKIDELFFKPSIVALALIIYGIIMIWLESRNRKPLITKFNQVSYKTAFLIGLFQVLALVPGTSRSGSTIIGATLLGTSRFIAAEFSFFLAIPTMLGASLLKLLKAGFSFTGFEWFIMFIGSLTAFIVSVIVIKFFMSYIKKHDFKAFGIYRIILGLIVFIFFMFN
ncbi:undecaprenyl-diphosphate phosphatase [Peptostreptococcus canis]|uniref:undecaprenyl-diphosphate phosphatase n=1 Tax=Peptostreptococcus canis TaxID=1159213 RepID=UPI0016259BC3|nr:undecaprenyl-diphosphate phosphatase [Peptostreptococcus canis]MBP1998834.1 undecaprenyl-diphosphatase [Peptostreptococcus canis]